MQLYGDVWLHFKRAGLSAVHRGRIVRRTSRYAALQRQTGRLTDACHRARVTPAFQGMRDGKYCRQMPPGLAAAPAISMRMAVMMAMAGICRLFFLALRAERPDLGFVCGQGKACQGHAIGQLLAHGGVADLGHGSAARTDH